MASISTKVPLNNSQGEYTGSQADYGTEQKRGNDSDRENRYPTSSVSAEQPSRAMRIIRRKPLPTTNTASPLPALLSTDTSGHSQSQDNSSPSYILGQHLQRPSASIHIRETNEHAASHLNRHFQPYDCIPRGLSRDLQPVLPFQQRQIITRISSDAISTSTQSLERQLGEASCNVPAINIQPPDPSEEQFPVFDPAVEPTEDDALLLSDVDVEGINLQNLSTHNASVQRVISHAAQDYISIPNSKRHSGSLDKGYHTRRPSLTPSVRSSSPSDYTPDDEGNKFCCNISRQASRQNLLGIDYCPGCHVVFCRSCWKKQVSHKGKGSPGHEKTSVKVAKWVSATLEINLNDEEQAVEHLIDKNSALWFAAGRDERGVPIFRDFERYSTLMAERAITAQGRSFPALVAFVGETGAGKSSLIKLLITTKSESHKTPVVGSSATDHIPTSGDVHLYCDPETFDTTHPILYADCEGLNGGTREPIAAKYKRRHSGNHDARKTQDAALRRHLRAHSRSSEREIQWATSPEKSSREFFVRNFYPRLLYTFSDVIVFVVKNVRAIENVIADLIIWADAVLEATSNQPVLPHAIIVLNASPNQHEKSWEVSDTTEELLDSLEEVVNTNDGLKRYLKKWRQKGVTINSMRALLQSYYSSVRVIRVPTGDNPRLLRDQVQKLYTEIQMSTKASLEFKLSVRMKLSSEELQPYIRRAFDHFCRTLETPFDFVKASYANCSIPPDFSGNILKLALNILKRWGNRLDGQLLFKELSFMIASCLMLDAMRRNILGTAGDFFDGYVVHFDEALEDFCDRYWPCEYVCNGGRCVNVRAGHSKGHQIASARIVVPNARYRSTFTAAEYKRQFFDDIYIHLQELLQKLTYEQKRDSEVEEMEAAIRLHRDSVLKHFYRHLGGAENYFSHSICLACLIFAPQHCLPCGHILCTPCVQAFGRRRGSCAVELSTCPLHDIATFNPECVIAVQPETAGVRVLSLDGGGIRGVVELKSLLRIEKELGGQLRVPAFFDLIVGTSTGGIIALGLGEKNWTVLQCLQKFNNFASRVFHKQISLSPISMLLTMFQHGKYDVVTLENVLKEQFGEERLFGGPRDQLSQSLSPRPKVAVTATRLDGKSFLFGSYNRPHSSQFSSYEFLRADNPEQEIKIWEAARATSAAPKIFRPFEHTASQTTFMDGGIYHNNPIEIATQEVKLVFPEVAEYPPDIVLSLGTGVGPPKSKISLRPFTTSKRDALSYHRYLLKIAQDHVKHSLKSEERWQDFISKQKEEVKSRYFRLNFDLNDHCPKTDDISNMNELSQFCDRLLDGKASEIARIADRLIATSFYFRPTQKPQKGKDGSLMLEGYIESRFPSGSNDIVALGELFRRKQSQLYNRIDDTTAQQNPSFVFSEVRKERDAEQVYISDDTIKGMIREGIFNMRKQSFRISNEIAKVDIYFCFDGKSYSQPNSISGFPRAWDADYRPTLRASLSLSKRRSGSPNPAKPEWSKPTAKDTTFLHVYANNDLPGLATESDISRIEQRLSEPETPSPLLTAFRGLVSSSTFEMMADSSFASSVPVPIELPIGYDRRVRSEAEIVLSPTATSRPSFPGGASRSHEQPSEARPHLYSTSMYDLSGISELPEETVKYELCDTSRRGLGTENTEAQPRAGASTLASSVSVHSLPNSGLDRHSLYRPNLDGTADTHELSNTLRTRSYGYYTPSPIDPNDHSSPLGSDFHVSPCNQPFYAPRGI